MIIDYSIQLTDTHAHICDNVFASDLDAVIERARSAGITKIISVGEDINDARRNLELSEKFTLIKPAAGLYPKNLDLGDAEEMMQFIRNSHSELYAIGEVGLDFWVVKDEKSKEIQKEIFMGFIKLSIELDLPLNVHSRSAGRHALKMLQECNAKRVQMHAFDGKTSHAMSGVEAGYFFSIPPSVVRSRQKQKLAKVLPKENLLLETDSPVLGSDPNLRNEPANLPISAQAIADIKGLPLYEILERVEFNASHLYGNRSLQDK
jgi:TatD DNase family protein